MNFAVTFPGLPAGYCYTGDLNSLFQAALSVSFVTISDSYTQIIVSETTPAPADQNKIWVQINGSGTPLGIFRYAAGSWQRIPGAPYYAVDSGIVNALAVSFASDFTITALPDLVGRIFLVKVGNTPTSSTTLAVNGLPATAITAGGYAVGANAFAAGQVIAVLYDGTSFQLLTPVSVVASSGVTMLDTPGAGNFTVPTGVFALNVHCHAGGGGGGFSATAVGGGGGGYGFKRWAVIPGQVIPYVVGDGGDRGSTFGSPDSTNGGDTTFNTSQQALGGTRGDSGGAGGGYSGCDFGATGQSGNIPVAADKYAGGISPAPGSYGGYATNLSTWAPTNGYRGGGGFGDRDSVSTDSSDGGAGFILITY